MHHSKAGDGRIVNIDCIEKMGFSHRDVTNSLKKSHFEVLILIQGYLTLLASLVTKLFPCTVQVHYTDIC